MVGTMDDDTRDTGISQQKDASAAEPEDAVAESMDGRSEKQEGGDYAARRPRN